MNLSYMQICGITFQQQVKKVTYLDASFSPDIELVSSLKKSPTMKNPTFIQCVWKVTVHLGYGT
jgi:hypothetical protein